MLQVAANRVLISQRNENMKTKGLAAELLYSLSPSLHVLGVIYLHGLMELIGYRFFKNIWNFTWNEGRFICSL